MLAIFPRSFRFLTLSISLSLHFPSRFFRLDLCLVSLFRLSNAVRDVLLRHDVFVVNLHDRLVFRTLFRLKQRCLVVNHFSEAVEVSVQFCCVLLLLTQILI